MGGRLFIRMWSFIHEDERLRLFKNAEQGLFLMHGDGEDKSVKLILCRIQD